MHRYDRRLIAAAVGLAGLAGLVDALGFLSMGGFFVSFMSGNTTRLGTALASDLLADAARAARLIALFVAGVMAGTLVAYRYPRWRKPAVLAVVTGLLAIAALCHAAGADHAALLITAAAMGVENGVFQRDGEVSVGLTYMTGTLVRFAQRAALALVGGGRWAWLPHLLLWLGFLGGAIGGTAVYRAIGLDGLWLAAGVAGAMTLIMAQLVRAR
jgi:uncharacterized membrane protein YoaK (UPF0700 family)